VITVPSPYSAAPGTNCIGYVKYFTLSSSSLTSPSTWQTILGSSTFTLPNSVQLVNATVVYQPSSGTNATVTQCFACIVPVPATQPDLYEGLAMTPVNFTVGNGFTSSVIIKVSRYFTVTTTPLPFCLVGYGVYTAGRLLSAIGPASVVQAIRVGKFKNL